MQRSRRNKLNLRWGTKPFTHIKSVIVAEDELELSREITDGTSEEAKEDRYGYQCRSASENEWL